MHSYTLLAPAKINLYLEIVGDRPDGFHELVMVMQTVALCDRITLRPNGLQEFRLFCSHPLVPQDSSNLAHRAATLMAKEFPRLFANYGGIDITIEKHIPVAAGLAGGSTNAAAVLVGIDLIWELGLTRPELETLAKIGIRYFLLCDRRNGYLYGKRRNSRSDRSSDRIMGDFS